MNCQKFFNLKTPHLLESQLRQPQIMKLRRGIKISLKYTPLVPMTFEEVKMNSEWIAAMNEEMEIVHKTKPGS